MNAGKQYLRAAEIAALTGMSLRTIRRWIRDEVLASAKIGGARLVAIADLEGLLSACRDTVQETFDNQGECNDES